jgi:hypothetical protein|tara:strand:+ start:495 stop:776 length:282 start_codon:yes stop_codon:yes gene_type:complete
MHMSIDAWTEVLSYIGMLFILAAFVLETRNVLHSKQTLYLALMAVGSGFLGVRAYLIDEWAFLILEAAWCLAAVVAYVQARQPTSSGREEASS